MKKKQKILIFVSVVILAISFGALYLTANPSDKCTTKDREIYNCVPAGKCGPTPGLDAIIDCEVKNYDKKYNPDL